MPWAAAAGSAHTEEQALTSPPGDKGFRKGNRGQGWTPSLKWELDPRTEESGSQTEAEDNEGPQEATANPSDPRDQPPCRVSAGDLEEGPVRGAPAVPQAGGWAPGRVLPGGPRGALQVEDKEWGACAECKGTHQSGGTSTHQRQSHGSNSPPRTPLPLDFICSPSPAQTAVQGQNGSFPFGKNAQWATEKP